MEPPLRIGELARQTGVSQRTLRYYEQQGLLAPAREANRYRVYDADAVETVRRIRTLLAAGLSTDVIRRVLPCVTEEGALVPCAALRATLRHELAELDERIEALSRSRALLGGLVSGVEDGAAGDAGHAGEAGEAGERVLAA